MRIIANGVVENRILPTARRAYAMHEVALVGVTFELGHFQSQCGKVVCFAARVAALRGCRQKVGGELTVCDGRSRTLRFEHLGMNCRCAERGSHGTE